MRRSRDSLRRVVVVRGEERILLRLDAARLQAVDAGRRRVAVARALDAARRRQMRPMAPRQALVADAAALRLRGSASRSPVK